MQFVVFKPLIYCYEETIGFDVKASFASRPLLRLMKWYNKPSDITKEVYKMEISKYQKRSNKISNKRFDWQIWPNCSKPVCSGKWARINTNNQNRKSISYYVICTSPLKYYTQEMSINEGKNYRLKDKSRSDHNTIMLTIKVKPKE